MFVGIEWYGYKVTLYLVVSYTDEESTAETTKDVKLPVLSIVVSTIIVFVECAIL